jgi:hypothetical protein
MGEACRFIRPGKPEAPTLGNNLMPGYIITLWLNMISAYFPKMLGWNAKCPIIRTAYFPKMLGWNAKCPIIRTVTLIPTITADCLFVTNFSYLCISVRRVIKILVKAGYR